MVMSASSSCASRWPNQPKRKKYGSVQVEESDFYSKLHIANPNAAALSLIPEYSLQFIPPVANYPPLLADLYKAKNLELPYHLLLKECDTIFDTIHVTESQAKCLERDTRDQAKCRLWFSHRSGRVTV